MSAPVLEFNAVSVAAGGKTLLGPVSASIDSTGITAVMGPNGAGKSLFLGAAHGLVALQSGDVTWNGSAAESSRASRGFVFQTTPVMRRSVIANVAFPLIARKVARAERNARLRAAMETARLAHVAHRPAAALSGGERKRLDLARALVNDPVAILLDEPAANLDPASTAELEASLRQIARRGIKVILSTHDIAQARRLADDVLFFALGRVSEQGPAKAFFEEPESQIARKYLKGFL